jgi:hypothetical protein
MEPAPSDVALVATQSRTLGCYKGRTSADGTGPSADRASFAVVVDDTAEWLRPCAAAAAQGLCWVSPVQEQMRKGEPNAGTDVHAGRIRLPVRLERVFT